MGVYIDMEMPTSCDSCRFMVFEDTNCAPELYCGCPIVFKAHPQGVGHRPDYCPLVLVPPHGRLGDLDAIEKQIDYIANLKWNIDVGASGGMLAALEVVEDAQTIIPASKEGET